MCVNILGATFIRKPELRNFTKKKLDHAKLLTFMQDQELATEERIDVYIRRIHLLRQNKFKMQDLHYQVYMKNVEGRPILVYDLLEVFHQSVVYTIKELQNLCKDKGELQQLYITIVSKHLNKGIGTGNYNLFTNATTLSFQIINMLLRFLVSNENIQLDKGFFFKFRILSEDHVKDRMHRKKNLIPHLLTEMASGKTCPGYPHRWEFTIPSGYAEQKTAFLHKCVPLSAIIGVIHRNYIKNPDSSDGKLFLEFEKVHSKVESRQKNAGFLLTKQYIEIVEKTGLSKAGPYDIGSTLALLADHFKVNFHVYCWHTKTIYWTSNSEIDFTKPTVYLLFRKELVKEFNEDGENIEKVEKHLSLIRNPKRYFILYGYWCLNCTKLIRDANLLHRCAGFERCFPCRRFLAKPDYYVDSQNENMFCNQTEVDSTKPVICKTCNTKMYSAACQELHASQCKKGFFCKVCNTYRRIEQGETLKQIELNHVHGEIYCSYCKINYTEKDHQCCLEKARVQDDWKNLAFFHFSHNISKFEIDDKLVFTEKVFSVSSEHNQREQFRYRTYLDPSISKGDRVDPLIDKKKNVSPLKKSILQILIY